MTTLALERLPGRDAELAEIDRLLAAARAGHSAALVVRGEAGIGKSTLLDHAKTAAGDMLVLARTGIETESELPYAALHLLLKNVLGGLDELPEAQAESLRTAFGLARPGPAGPPDRLLVGLAVLTLIADLATHRPVLVVLDDAHWFDRASADALLFAARRLDAESVVMLFAARDGHAPAFPTPGLPQMELSRLDDATARQVLDGYAAGLPRPVKELLLREAAGNPLALRELPAAHLADRAPVFPLGPPDAGRNGTPPTHSIVEREFAARIAGLPSTARTLLLVAAADGTCDTGVVLAAAARLGAGPSDLETLEREHLIMFGGGCFGFQHPLIRTAVYSGATFIAKQAAHRALADVLDAVPELDRRNWHRAAASVGPDEDVALALEESAARARARGSHEAVAAAYERAAGLSATVESRVRRYVLAAGAAADAGHRDWAERIAVCVAPYAVEPVQGARLAMVRARLADQAGHPEETHRLLLEAVGPAAAADPDLAAEMLLWAIEAGWTARDRSVIERAAATADALRLPDPHVRVHAAVAAAQLSCDPVAAVPAAVAALDQLAELSRSAGTSGPRATAGPARWHLLLGADTTANELATAAERGMRTAGTLSDLPRILAVAAASRWHLGHWRDAEAAASEGLRIARETGQVHPVEELVAVQALVAAAGGDETRTSVVLAELDERRLPPDFAVVAAAARSLLDIGLGRFETAADRLAVPSSCPRLIRSLPDFVEAAVRTGRTEQALAANERFERWAGHVGQAWARAVALRCRALVECCDDPEDVAALYAEAVDLHHVDSAHPFERARTELLQGEWLRRARRRSEARSPLRAALETFEELGARPWAERARAELRATGETRNGTGPGRDVLADLTPQELQVVRLAAEGLSNRDIGAQLFLSPRTVGYHLYKAFPKLGVASRAQLMRLDLPA